MSLVTSCPACSTRFKLVPDQLKVSEGWVRCGQCMEVFDASSRIETDPALKPSTTLFPVLTEEAVRMAAAAQAPVSDEEEVTPVSFEPVRAATPLSQEHESSIGIPPSSLETSPVAGVPASELAEDILSDVPSTLETHDPTESELDRARADVTPTPDEEVGFIREARRNARWANPWVRLTLWLLVMLLLGVLAIQVVRMDRDRLSAQYPSASEWVSSVCELTQCEVQPYHDVDAVVIDGTKFTKLATDSSFEAYQLELVLKSKAAYAVAWPSLELSLTNSQDQVVLRKVFSPKEYAGETIFPAATERNASLALKVQTPGLAGRVSGYRAMLFYP